MFNINKYCIESKCNKTNKTKHESTLNNSTITKAQQYSQYVNVHRSGSAFIKVNIPYPPRNISGVVGNKQINLTWDVPISIGGSRIIEYKVLSVSGDVHINKITKTNNTIIDGLTNGHGYSFVVFSRNIVGISIASNPSPIIIPISVPGVPTNIKIDGFGNKFVNISWRAPTENGGSPVIKYVVTIIETNTKYESTSTSITISGLVNDLLRTVNVLAVNATGKSLPSISSDPFKSIFTVPDSPLLNTTAGLYNSVNISWYPPLNDGGYEITSYTISIADITPVLDSLPPQSTSGFPKIPDLIPTTTSYIIPNLSYNYKYSFHVVANSTKGSSLPLTISGLTTKTVPSSPTDIIVTPYNGYIIISWKPPLDAGNTEILGYTVQSIPATIIYPTTATSQTIRGLSQTTKYTFSVYATNIIGNSIKLISSTAVYPATTPSPPTTVTTVPGNGQVTLSWIPPLNTGGLAISSYTIKCYLTANLSTLVNQPVITNSGFITNSIISGLINGTSYTFFVFSTTAAGDSTTYAKSPSVIPGTVPDPPTDLTVLFIDYKSVNISWTPPVYNGGYEIKSYKVTSTAGANLTIDAGNNQTGIISGLSSGKSYLFNIIAKSDYGFSNYSTIIITTDTTIPDPPIITKVTKGDSNVTIDWAPPLNTGGLAIVSYIINSKTVINGSPVIHSQTVLGDSNTTRYVFPNLMNGALYSFTMFAGNRNGFSNSSISSNNVIPTGVPDPPTGIIGIAVDYKTINLSWNAPVNNGGYNIAYYTITMNSGTPFNVSTQTTNITNLLPGTSYTFIIVAVNNNNTYSNPSQSITVTTKTTIPDPPTNITGVPGNGKIVLSWKEPANTGGASINYYTIISTINNQIMLVPTNSSPTTSATITGLTNGTPYVFSMISTNINGNSSPSLSSSSIIPITTVPDKPTNIILIPGNNSATLSWTAPVNTGGSPVSSYTVTALPGNMMVTVSGTVTTATISGLENETSYCFLIVASNTVGNSTPAISISNTSNIVINGTTGITGTIDIEGTNTTVGLLGVTGATPNPPTNVVSLPGNQSAIISWVPPINTGGMQITSYTITSTPGNIVVTTLGSLTTKTITGLTNGISYYFSIVASNNYTSSIPATSITGSIGIIGQANSIGIIGLPSSPTNIISSPGNNRGIVSWTPPITTGGSPISSYTVTSSPGNVVGVTNGTTTTTQLTGLTNGTSYYFSVLASNTYSSSILATSIMGSTGLMGMTGSTGSIGIIGIPSSPIKVGSSYGNNSGTVSWDPPINTGGLPISSYTVTSTPGNVVGVTDGTTTTTQLTGLTNGTSYYFSVLASNTYAGSISVTSIAGSTGINGLTGVTGNIGIIGVPNSPTNVLSLPGNQYGFVSWSPPVNTGGEPISSYSVVCSPGNLVSVTSGDVTEAIINGLNNGRSYSFSVSASNGYVSSIASRAIGMTAIAGTSDKIGIIGAPEPPNNIISVSGNQFGTVNWKPPNNTGGSEITSYTVTSSPGNVVGVTIGTVTSKTLTGLTNGTSYYFSVMASNAYANSIQATSIAGSVYTIGTTGVTGGIGILGKPESPSNIASIAGNQTGTISWVPPTNTEGAPITSYTVTSSPGNVVGVTDGNTTTTTLTGLTNGTSYYFSVMASNTYGISVPSTSIIGSTGLMGTTGVTGSIGLIGIPTPPTNITSIAGNKSGTVYWSPPVNTGGVPISSYTVMSSPGNVVGVAIGSVTTKTLTGLTNGTSYYFSVMASNTYANSVTATSIIKSTGLIGTAGLTGSIGIIGVPNPPTNITSTAGNESGTVYWIPPMNTGGLPITSYTVTSSPGNVVGVTNGSTTTLTGLTNGTSYYFSVMASNTYANSVSATSVIGSTGITGVTGVTGFIGIIGN